MIDYYRVLKMSPDADFATIKRAYRARALESHPDRGGSDQAMLEINEAFEILGNSELRRRYDEARRDETKEAAQQSAGKDASEAKRRAENYPRDWNEFDAWLESLAKDIQGAKYGQAGMIPTVQNSSSGCLLWVIGAVIGGFLEAQFFEGSNKPRMVMFSIVGGAAFAMWIHKCVGQSLQSRGTSPESSTKPQGAAAKPSDGSRFKSQNPVLIHCLKCGQQLRLVPTGVQLRVRCPACRCEFNYLAD
jgi:hypothetical protein